jgi:hypothetical protein
MKLAIEHLQESVAATERRLTVVQDALKVAQRQVDQHAAEVELNKRKLQDLNAALAELRKPLAPERATVVDQIQKTQLADSKKQEPLALKARKS